MKIIPFGLMKKKSGGSDPYGDEILINGDFSTPFVIDANSYLDGWISFDTSLKTVANGILELTKSAGEYCRIYASIVDDEYDNIVEVGKEYIFTYDVLENNSSAEIRVFYDGGYSVVDSTVDSHSIQWNQTSATTVFIVRSYTDGALIKLDNFSLKEVL